jgi:hypothetical protein
MAKRCARVVRFFGTILVIVAAVDAVLEESAAVSAIAIVSAPVAVAVAVIVAVALILGIPVTALGCELELGAAAEGTDVGRRG